MAALLAALLLIGLAVLHLPSIRGRVLDRARDYASREFDITLGASSLSYNLLTRSIDLRDLSVASRSAADPFLLADRAIIEFGPGIYLGRPTITRISLSQPRLTLIRQADGTINLPSSQAGTERRSPLHLGVVSVTALSMRLDDRMAQRAFTVGPFDLSVDTTGSNQSGAFGPGGFTVRAGQIETSGTIAGRLGFDGSRVRIDDLAVETNEGRVALTGWADVTGERPAMSSRINATVNLPHAARLARVDARGLVGYVEGTIDVAGALTAPDISLTVRSRDTSYPPIGSFTLSGRSSLSGSRVDIQALDVESTAGSFHLQSAIALDTTSDASALPSHVDLRWSDLRVDDLVQAIGYLPPIRSGSLASGSGRINFDARDRTWSRLRLSATTTLEPVPSASGQEFLALSGRADLKLDGDRWSLRHAIQSRNASADLRGDLTGVLSPERGPRSTLAGRSRLHVTDAGAVVPMMQAAGLNLPVDMIEGLAGSVAATLDLAGTTVRPRARIELAVRDLRARVLPHTGILDARLDVDANGIRVHDAKASSGTTSLQMSGQYGWRGPFDARFEVSQGELSEIASQFRLPMTVTGSARVEGTVTGPGPSGQALVSLSARDVAVEDVSIGTLDAKGQFGLIDGGPITVDASAPNLGAHAHLDIVNRAGYPFSGEITLDNDQIGRLIPPRYQQHVGDLSGTLSATALGSGTLSDPAGIRGRIDLRGLDVLARGTRLRLAAPGSVTVATDRIAIDSVDLRIGQQTRATLGGQLGTTTLAEPFKVHLNGPLSELIEISSRTTGAVTVPVRTDGTAAFDLTVGGTFNHPLPTGTLAIRSSSLEYGSLAPMTNLALDAVIDPSLITLQALAAQWQGASLGGGGTLPWRVVVSSILSPPEAAAPQSSSLARWLSALPAEPARAKLTVRADNVTQAILKDVLGPDRIQQIDGTASAAIAVEADRLALERIEATALLNPASLSLAGVPFTQTVPTRLRLQNGRASIDDFRWSAEGNSIVATGGIDLTTGRSIDFGLSGVLDLRVVGAFVSGVTSGGTADADLRVTGPIDNPEIVGRITVADGELQLDSPRLAASDLAGTVQVAAGRQLTVSLAGLVNTGNSRLEGTLNFADLAAPLGKLHFTASSVALEYPSGMQTESNVDLDLALDRARSMLSGRIDVLGGTYREALVLSNQLLNFTSTSSIAQAGPPAEWLSRIGLNVAVATASDVRIDNNYGRLDIGATLRIVGTAANPGILGRLQAGDDGEIYLGGNTYRIERLVVDLANPRALTPELNFAAQTRVGDLPIGIELHCPAAGACERKVTSLANRGDDKEAEARLFGTGGGAAATGESFARLLSTELLGVVGRTVGLDTVRLEQGAEHRDIFDDPTLVAGDVNPAARLTLGKRLGSNVELVYSQNLANEGFTWITSYTAPYGLSARLLVLDDQSRAYEFRHEPIGGGRTSEHRRPPGPRIVEVRIQGTPGFSEKEVRRQLRLTAGDRFTFGAWQRDRDQLERFYHKQEFLEARIRARRLVGDHTEVPGQGEPGASNEERVRLEYAITRGPSTRLVVRGAILPDAVRNRIIERWTSALFDGFLIRDAQTIVRDHLYREGYLNAALSAAVALDAPGNIKTLTIDVVPGSIVPWRITVTGNAALPEPQLIELASAGNPLAAWTDPAAVERRLEDHYRAEGFLAADVTVGRPVAVSGTSVVTISVVEGTPYSLSTITLTGLPDNLQQEERDTLALASGERYQPTRVMEGVERLAASLRKMAYRQARADVETRPDPKTARVDVSINVTPGPRSILRDVVVEGGDAGKPRVAESIALETGAPLDPAAIVETRRRLYDLNLYRSVDIDVQPLESAPEPPSVSAPLEQPVVATIALVERPRYRFRYGLSINDSVVGPDERDRRLGFAADLDNRNLFGRGATASASVRLRRDQQVGRVSLGTSRLFSLPIRSTVFVEREREQLDPDGAFPITSDISSLTGEQAYRIRPSIDVRYGYSIEKNHTFIRSETADPFDLTVKVARFTTSGLVDRRDDAFNPARGWFTASTLEFSTPGIGSDLKFLKDFVQYSHYVPVRRGLVLASAARLGLARTFGDEVLIPSERFYAGGANTVRGYREEELGAQSVLGGPEGGSALLVLNGELRFPIYRWLKGVGFVDMGNVYPKVSDISFTNLQVGVGAGARFDTPFGLIRFDFGVPANPRPFDPRWRFYFGLGHAF